MSCFHGTTATFIPAAMTDIRCGICHADRIVVNVISDDHIFKIRCDDCRYARRYGIAKYGAVAGALAHKRSTHHSIKVIFGARVVASYAQAEQPSLFGSVDGIGSPADDVPPF